MMSDYHLTGLAEDDHDEEEPCLAGARPKTHHVSPWRSFLLLGGKQGNSPEPGLEKDGVTRRSSDASRNSWSPFSKAPQKHSPSDSSKTQTASLEDSGVKMGSISSNTSSLLDSPTKDSLWTNWRNTFKKKSLSSSSSSCSSLQLSGCSLDESASDPFLTSETSSRAEVVQSPNRPKRNYVGFTPARLSLKIGTVSSTTTPTTTQPSKKTLLEISNAAWEAANAAREPATTCQTKSKWKIRESTSSCESNSRRRRSSVRQTIDLSASVRELEKARSPDNEIPSLKPPPTHSGDKATLEDLHLFKPIQTLNKQVESEEAKADQPDSEQKVLSLLQPRPQYELACSPDSRKECMIRSSPANVKESSTSWLSPSPSISDATINNKSQLASPYCKEELPHYRTSSQDTDTQPDGQQSSMSSSAGMDINQNDGTHANLNIITSPRPDIPLVQYRTSPCLVALNCGDKKEASAALLDQGVFPETESHEGKVAVNLETPMEPASLMGKEIVYKANIRRCNELLSLLGQLKKTFTYDIQDESERLLDEEVMRLTAKSETTEELLPK